MGVFLEMDSILKICKENNILVIEDSACAVRSFYKGNACGTMGDLGIWSFDAMKILCTGDGGMLYIKDSDFMNIAKEDLYLGTPAKQKSGLDSSANKNVNWWEFEINRPGRRAIMNDVTGAIGNVQLDKVAGFINKREKVHKTYMDELKKLSWIKLPPSIKNYNKSSYYFFGFS